MSLISGSSTATYNYDYNGNVRYDTHRGIGYIIYDPNNLPVYAFLTNGQQLIYENDVNGSRVRNTISGTSDNFYFNGVEGKTDAVTMAAYGSNLIYNILGAGGDNIGQVKVLSKATKRYYYLKDHLGSIKVTVDTTGTVVGYDDYYPYGMQMSGRSLVASEDGRYKFTGKERDASEGLDYFGARYYDSWNARWLQVDPLADDHPSESPYVYCNNEPIIIVDKDGKEGEWKTDQNGNKQYVLDPVYASTTGNNINWSQLGSGVLAFAGGMAQATLGFTAAAASSETGVGFVGGIMVGMDGLANAGFGFVQAVSAFSSNNNDIPSGPLQAIGKGVDQNTGQNSYEKLGTVTDGVIQLAGALGDVRSIGSAVRGIDSMSKSEYVLRIIDFASSTYSVNQDKQAAIDLVNRMIHIQSALPY